MYFNLFRLLNKFYWIKKETNMKKRTTARNKATNNDTYCRECLCFAPSLFVLRSFFFFFLFFSSLKDKSCLRRLSGYHVLPYTINQPLLEHITRITQLYFSSKAYLMFRTVLEQNLLRASRSLCFSIHLPYLFSWIWQTIVLSHLSCYFLHSSFNEVPSREWKRQRRSYCRD